MKNFLGLLLCILFLSTASYADHVVGYDMTLINIKNANGTPSDNYKFRIKFFRDVLGIPIPTGFSISIYKNTTNDVVISNIACNKINPQQFLSFPPEDCAPKNAQLSVEYGIYETAPINLSTYSNTSGYYAIANICCRNIGITNVFGNSSTYSLGMTMDFPRLNTTATTRYNSSPEFLKYPLTIFCIGKPYTLNWNCVDPDGDSLVFSLAKPLDNNGPKPHAEVPYAAGYNLSYNILDGVPDLSINPKTGVINFIPTKIGKYLVAFKCEEFRNGVKIGEIRREYQLETILCLDAPPVTEDNNNQKKVIVDTIDFDEDYSIKFTSRDTPTDSLFMYIIPNISVGENLLDPSGLNGKWGEPGSLIGGAAAQNLIIKDNDGTVEGEFAWTPKCKHVREKPYNFTVVVRDQTCPSPFYDSTFVSLYVRKKPNIKPYFTLPDTIKTTSSSIKKVRRYYVNAGDTMQLAADSSIRTYDQDSTQVVNISILPDPNNGNVNSRVIFSSFPNVVHSTAVFQWKTLCADRRDNPYIFDFIAYDDDCAKKDTVSFRIEVYVKDQPNIKSTFADNTISEIHIPEGSTIGFNVVAYDTIANKSINKYKLITIYPDFTDFAAVTGGVMPVADTVSGLDSAIMSFSWSPNCANISTTPYKLKLRCADEGCPTINSFKEILIYADGPFNSAPTFISKGNSAIQQIDTSIYSNELFKFDVFAIDTNNRFDSVYIDIDVNSDITNANRVRYPATMTPVFGKDSARTILTWQTDCADIRTAPYVARIFARDNECVNPEQAILTFNITVLERPNFTPSFTSSTIANFSSTNFYNTYASDTLIINLAAYDTLQNELITIDSVFTNIPINLPKPEIIRTSGNGKDTVYTQLYWLLDCSLIRDEPYTIRLAAWDEACRNPQDSSTYQFQVKVNRNPLLNPLLNISQDTLIELVAGEKFTLDIFSSSIRTGDSILIASTGDVYGGIVGNFATFEQTQVQGQAQAKLYWETSCDQVRDDLYYADIFTLNSPCKTDSNSIRITFKIIPNTDVTNTIPNVFSPNGDNINDVYSINKQYKVYCDPKFKFSIFNRWGKKVFESIDPDFEWSPGDGIGAGTYFYTIQSRAKTETGTIDIIK